MPSSTPSYLQQVYDLYYRFLSYVPSQYHGVISLVLAVVLVYSVYKIIKRNFVYLILLVVLLPSAVPILKTLWNAIYEFLQFLLRR